MQPSAYVHIQYANKLRRARAAGFKAVRQLSLCASIFTIAGSAYLDEEQYLMKLDAPVMIIIIHPDKFTIDLSFDSTKQLNYEYAHTEPFD